VDQNVEMLLLNKINKQVDIVSGVHIERERERRFLLAASGFYG